MGIKGDIYPESCGKAEKKHIIARAWHPGISRKYNDSLSAIVGKNEAAQIIEANATLMASAPDLLAALKNFMNGAETGAITSEQDEVFTNAIKQAKKAISKAENRQ